MTSAPAASAARRMFSTSFVEVSESESVWAPPQQAVLSGNSTFSAPAAASRSSMKCGFEVDSLDPHHWGDFVGDKAEELDFVFTLSDTAAGEKVPDWPGGPVTAHWSYPDPILVEGEAWEKRQAYGRLLAGLERHLRTFMEFPIATLDRLTLQQKIDELGRAARD